MFLANKRKMFSEEYSRYTLLAQGHRTWSMDKRTVILLSALIFPVFIFCATYMTLFGIYEKIVYPHSVISKVPQPSLHRAVLYNTFNDEAPKKDIHFKATLGNDEPQYKLVCYYNFPYDRQTLQVKDLDPALCTHINVAFAQIVNNTIFLETANQKTLSDLVRLKNTNKDLKILLSIGGAGAGSGFPDMVSNHTNRKTFIKSVINYVKKFNIDGVDLDWEFPNEHPGGDKRQRIHFTQLLEELRQTVKRQPKYKFLISLAVAAPAAIVDNSYDIAYINEFVDYVNLMSYDYHFYTKYTPFTGINAPLYPADDEKLYLASLNINYSVNYWNSLGMEKSKIVVGLPTYGHTFRLTNARNNGLYAPCLGYGKLGSLGFVDYPQVCAFLSSNRISPVFNMDTRSPYAFKFTEWISFDNAESFTYKAEYIRDNKFGGAMVYSINSDDFRGVCETPGGKGERFPLIKVVRRVLIDKDVRVEA